MSSIRLYHGTADYFEEISLDVQRPGTDFGRAFYMSVSLEDAKNRAFSKAVQRARARRTDIGKMYVYSVKVNLDDLKNKFSIKSIQDDIDWVDYIVYNRGIHTVIDADYDIVIGKTADDNVDKIIAEAIKLRIDKAPVDVKLELVKKLKINRLATQYAFKTNESVNYLNTSGITVEIYARSGGKTFRVQN